MEFLLVSMSGFSDADLDQVAGWVRVQAQSENARTRWTLPFDTR